MMHSEQNLPEMYLILPAAGQSSRFPRMRPKWMLTHPSGNMMLIEAIRGLNLEAFKEIHVGFLKEHLEEYLCLEGVKEQFAALGVLEKLHITIFDHPTGSQPETIAQLLQKNAIKGPIFCKDVDNYYSADVQPGNSLGVFSLGHTQYINPSNKSYAILDHVGKVQNIVEKKVISEFFCVGGYGFDSADLFLKYYDDLKDQQSLYVSDLIFKMLLDNVLFNALHTKDYYDWGTLEDWNRYKRQYATLFVDLDGTLVENGGEFTPPFWGETKAIEENVRLINRFYDSGKGHVVITTSRGEKWREETLKQLAREGIKYHRILFGFFHAQRIVINDFAASNPFPSAIAVNIQRNDKHLEDYLKPFS